MTFTSLRLAAGGSLVAGGWSSKKGVADEAKMFVVAEINPAERLVTFKTAKVNEQKHFFLFLLFVCSLLFFCPLVALYSLTSRDSWLGSSYKKRAFNHGYVPEMDHQSRAEESFAACCVFHV